MRLLFILSLLGLAFIKCNSSNKTSQQKSFNDFDFSYNDVFSTCFSIKFTQGDTVFIRQHFAPYFSDTPKSKTTYYTLLTKTEKATLDSFIKQFKFSDFDTLYYQPYEDGIDYQYYFENDTIQKIIRVHSDSTPFQLIDLKNWIVNTKKTLHLHQIDSIIDFKSTKYFLQPTVTEPKIKFKPPKVE